MEITAEFKFTGRHYISMDFGLGLRILNKVWITCRCPPPSDLKYISVGVKMTVLMSDEFIITVIVLSSHLEV